MPTISYECRHIMPSGAKCHAIALKGKPYCYNHIRVHRFIAGPPSDPMDTIQLGVLEDRYAILLAIAKVTDALCSGRLDSRRARTLLYAIQLASQNIDKSRVPAHETVEFMTETDTGEELGPSNYICGDDKCAVCPEGNTCGLAELEEDDEKGDEEEAGQEDEPKEEAIGKGDMILTRRILHKMMSPAAPPTRH